MVGVMKSIKGARIWNDMSKTDLFRSCKYIANYDWIENVKQG